MTSAPDASPARTAAPQGADGTEPYVLPFVAVGISDVPRVGGKNASLGEMIQHLGASGVRVPDGFATTAEAYRRTIADAGLEAPLREAIAGMRDGSLTLQQTGETIRRRLLEAPLPDAVVAAIRDAYRALCEELGEADAAVAVRSSATAEDLPDASFAGQQETFLNISGEVALLDACRRCYASLFTDRAISYRETKGFDHLAVALSIGVQHMVRSDEAGSGVMFSLDPDTGFPDVVSISAAWGLGETVVQGAVDPDAYSVFKPLLDVPGKRPIIGKKRGRKARKMVYASGGSARTQTLDTSAAERQALVLGDDEVLTLARWACAIERHYGRAMDMEWAKDGRSGELYIVQARPETVQAARRSAPLRSWHLDRGAAEPIVTGAAVGQAIAAGEVCLIRDPADIAQFRDGAVLVTEMTDPDWVPIMRKASGIVTDHGGTTSHAAIVSRELGVPAIIGTGNATELLKDGDAVTLSCAEGDEGRVYPGTLDFSSEDIDVAALPDTRTQLMVNLADPDTAFSWWRLPAKGVGLARMEFIVSNWVRVHPMALVHPERVTDRAAKREIAALTRGYADPKDYFVETLALGVARIAAACHPHPAIVRLSDFKTNEYAHLLGGAGFEPHEENPMLGFRGASRYYNERYREGFALECRALKRVRETIGLDNLIVMVPFCRTPDEADRVLAEMAANGLTRGEDGLQVYVMCEIPANVLRAEEFAQRFDGFSIGSNDLTQMVLGIDRDSAMLAPLFDERDPAVKAMIAQVIDRAHESGAKVGICGQAPSNYPEFARFLVEQGIDSISLNPDSFVKTIATVAQAETAAGAD
ncbi:phosphoenolpyruvate synthase [Stakelama tenebrarum]|uniref:Phosphoenolpyruvate synthase n=1 Tax=Stakelama tenebrarum TaxID=2711215 RepID=A0A6G6YA18_9SPHN|nr:phosphoenolpyruvate synthase [Sphingosinithalassobacter tenebrarum]QIG81750.1 phosphoenolpyruvate synthase [Sphingosinithalassobacter tenebrarum]